MTTLNEHHFIEKLIAAGMDKTQAELIAAYQADQAVTKIELLESENRTGEKIHNLRLELKGEISELRAELKGDISALRAELKGEISALRMESRTDIAALRIDNQSIKESLKSLEKVAAMQNKILLTIGFIIAGAVIQSFFHL